MTHAVNLIHDLDISHVVFDGPLESRASPAGASVVAFDYGDAVGSEGLGAHGDRLGPVFLDALDVGAAVAGYD
eukprot:CAMPEP_0182520808 /NCGR_PEP_ID=MMETSP1321-20130603/45802_1 /TAXON_ID=91990 /ORGANISM="Bolidomonas sp., Strain RCC1657" /LENGTH=72 /DNA_ID=CAMNT_0024728823 /DNA_START=470 /DNA_END=688 /DNA_ORIENTATION=-